MNDIFNTRTTLLTGTNTETKREEIRKYFHQTFDVDEHLFEVIANEKALYMRADPLRHPLIFYFGHTAVFYINKLILAKLLNNRINPKFESMFAIGVDEMSWDDLNMAHYDWPAVEEVRQYRKSVRETIDQLINQMPLSLPIGWENPFWIIMMGIEHSRIHLETSSVLIRQLPIENLKPISNWKLCTQTAEAPHNELIAVKGRIVELGKPFDHELYGWDNEYGKHQATIDDFKASKYLCSNAEFMQFIEYKGYETQSYWTDEGWHWNQFDKKGHPRFWRKTEKGWKLRLVYKEIDMPWDWPVEVNYLEAKAFCNWKAAKTSKPIRLPMEEEWQVLYENAALPDQPYWEKAPGNLNMEHYQSPAPVNAFAFGAFFDIVGNVWQWTETPITGFNGFKVHPLYDDFSTPTFDHKHNIIKGGSWISTGNEATRYARYAFRRHFYQHAGFRYIESNQPVIVQQNIYETDAEVVRHCEAHYGKGLLAASNYRESIANFCTKLIQGRNANTALDLGCKVGRSSFELAKVFKHVTGLDFTARNIKVASRIREEGNAVYAFPDEGELVHFREINATKLGFDQLIPKVEFWQADSSNMKASFTGYDLILLNDMLDETYDPAGLLASIHQRINPGGLLVIASAYNWSEEQVQKVQTIGGLRVDGEPLRANDALVNLLSTNFKQLGQSTHLLSELPFNSRKSELKKIEVSVWEHVK